MTQRPFDPERSIYHEANAQDVVNMLLENVMGENNGEYPENDEVDGLAPSLKGLIMRQIDASTLRSCKHMEHDVKQHGGRHSGTASGRRG